MDKSDDGLILEGAVLTIDSHDPRLSELRNLLDNQKIPHYISKIDGFGQPELRLNVFDPAKGETASAYSLRGPEEIKGFAAAYKGPHDFLDYLQERREEMDPWDD